jgi:3-hydroxyacyl-CoA dehydrogenase
LTETVRIEREGAVALIVIDHPPVNAMSYAVRAPLLAAIEACDGDADIHAIIIHGTGRHFVAGADISEFDAGPQPPLLNDVLLRLEACTKPVIAALHGATLGGGAELALASHFRAAATDLSFGFPETQLGLIPGSGGTVRLPRLVGLDATLRLMKHATPIGLADAVRLGLVDRVLDGDTRAAAISWARELIEAGTPPRRTRDIALREDRSAADTISDAVVTAGAPRHVRAAVRRLGESLRGCVTLSFRDALSLSREQFEACRVSEESRALRHLFFAERARLSEEGARTVRTVGIVGAGTMGTGIAISVALAGYDVLLFDQATAALQAARERIQSTLDGMVRRGRLTAEQAGAAADRVRMVSFLATFFCADLVIEAAFENLDVKRAIFAELADVCRDGTVLATNTSTLDIDAIAAGAVGRQRDVVGMHFFSPAHVMKLVEVVPGAETCGDCVATVAAITRRIGKIGVRVGNAFGFVGNRMLYAYGREKELMLLEGATPQRIDAALESFGMAMGPNAVGDLAGLDVGWNARRAWAGKPVDPRYYRVSDYLVELGRYGQKTGLGFYRYSGAERQREVDPELPALIRREAERLGVPQREIEDAEIVDRCILALVNEGALLLEHGIAKSAADIDVIWCNGYGFPRERGGPMHYAESRGLTAVVARIRELGAICGTQYWSPAPRLELCAREARRFDAVRT